MSLAEPQGSQRKYLSQCFFPICVICGCGQGVGSMRFIYDPKFNIAYIRFQEKSAEVETLKVSDELNIDLSSDGTIYGIELLNANEQIHGQDKGKLLLINETTGEKAELPL